MKTRADRLRQPLLAGIVFLLAILVGGGTAYAEPSDDEKAEARAAADTAAAEFVCDLLPVPEGDLMGRCVSFAESAASKAPSIEEMQPEMMCAALIPLGPVPTVGCLGLVSLNVAGLRDTAQKAYDNTIGKAGEAIGDTKEIVDFVNDPQSALEDLANTLKEGATDFLHKIMEDLVNIGSADFSAKWWRDSYAAAGGIGLVVSAFVMMLVLKDAALDRISAHQFGESIQYLFGGIVSMVWAPVIAYVVQDLINAFSLGIVEWGGKDLLLTVLDGTIFSVTATTMPGGIVMGLFFWLMLFLGALMVFVMFIAQGLAVYLTAAGMGIAFGMLAHPRWRAKALRVPMLVLGIMLAKPLLLFVLMVLFKMIQDFDPMSAMGLDALKTLGEGCMIVLALIFVGLAPWAAFRFIPLLPDGSEVSAGGLNPAGAAAGGAGSALTTMGMRRMQRGGGGGGGGSTGGTSSTTMRSAPSAPSPGGKGGGDKASGGGLFGGFGKSGKAGAASSGGGAMAGKAGTAGGGAGGGAALAGGTAVSGGALLVAAAAAKGGQHLTSSARSAAEGSAPQMQGSTSEEMQSSMHDRRKWGE